MKDSIESIIKSVIDSVIRQNCILAGISLYIRRTAVLMTFLMIIFQCFSVIAATNYVWSESPSPTPPYTSWSTAARTIQEAIDAAQEGDTVLVTNGIYSSGGREVDGVITNRVTIDKPLLVQSVNGPEYTLIVGSSGLNGGNSDGAIRCVYMCTNATLIGFTITNGHTATTNYNCDENSGGGALCGTGCVISNCVFIKNSADYGGGVCRGTLYDCILTNNSATFDGGGAYLLSTLYNCTLANNSAGVLGGGVSFCTLYNSTLTGNFADKWGGGGADTSTLYNCTLIGNLSSDGGGAIYSKLYNCILTDNVADDGGGADGSWLYNCTVAGNSAMYSAGGVGHCTNYNCIVFYNTAPNYSNYYYSIFNYSCTAPFLLGEGNIDYEPMFVDLTLSNLRLQPNSPCINAGNTDYVVNEIDLDGNPRVVDYIVDMGAYEYQRVLNSPKTYYVNAESQSPTPPYTSWSTAARTIQEAIDSAQEGDTILVTNGVYSSGGRKVDGDITNRVTIDKPLLVQSVNGPEYTLIVGSSGLNGGNSDGAIRCVYMCTNAVLSGFTLTNGHTRPSLPGSEVCLGGGAYCGYNSVIGNCVIVGNSAYNGGGVYYGALYNCILKDNLADNEGGGAYYCKLYNCVLAGNSAHLGGGVSDYSTLYDCILTNNSAWFRGGGALYSTLYNCILANNFSEDWGGGTDSCVLYNCTLTGNVALFSSGGAENSALYNCTLTHNLAYGVGAAGTCTLYNCTVTDNSAWYTIGGVSGSDIYNCIVYYNNAPDCPDYCNSTFTYSCAVPLPPGKGNISGDPLLASTTHLSANSPCIGKGSSQYNNGVDIDGEQWLNPPSMGADEYIPGNAKGPLFVSIGLKSTNVVTGYSVSLVAQIQGQVSASVWDFGDGVVVSNQAYTSHIWSSPGVYTVRLTGYNDSITSGESATIMINAVISTQSIFYVDAKSPSPSFPYSGWETAARTIQEAIDAGDVIGQRLVLVTNGVYDTGGKVMQGILTNRVLLPQGVVVKSVNGPSVTFIVGAEAPGGGNGNGAVRCAFLDTNAILSGFTLTNGHTRANTTDECIAGGAFCRQGSIISNCVLISNSSGLYGGGVVRGTLYNCILTGNSSLDRGGGTYYCMLYNCTVTGNSSIAGGTYEGTNYNCIIYYNFSTRSNYSDYCNYAGSATYYSCTTPLPPGEGNITNEPMFVDLALGDLRLQPNSPCINSGNNLYVKTEVDSDGKPRIYGGAVDIGAYEFQSASSLISYAWLQNYGLPIDGSADYLDSDGDGLNNFAEWRCGTNPTNQMSVFRLLDSQNIDDFLILSWAGVSGRSYRIEYSTNLFATPAFRPLATNIIGINGTMTYTNTALISPAFYRIGVE